MSTSTSTPVSPFPDVAGAPARPEPATSATVTSARVDWAPVPKVNLLPAEIADARRLGRLKRLLAVAVVATVALCAGGVAWGRAQAASAQAELDAVQSRSAQLSAEQARYAQVPRVLGLIDSAGAARERALGRDVLWYGFLSDLAVTTPPGVTLGSLQVDLDKAATVTDPLVPTGIGTVSFTGQAQRFADLATWLDAVATLPGVDGSTLTTATRGDGPGGAAGGLTFTSTVAVTGEALTHRYDRKAS